MEFGLSVLPSARPCGDVMPGSMRRKGRRFGGLGRGRGAGGRTTVAVAQAPGNKRTRLAARPLGGEWGGASSQPAGQPATLPEPATSRTAAEDGLGGFAISRDRPKEETNVSDVTQRFVAAAAAT